MKKEYIVLGGIKYLIRFKSDHYISLTKPYGRIEYIAPKDCNTGAITGLPITKGVMAY